MYALMVYTCITRVTIFYICIIFVFLLKTKHDFFFPMVNFLCDEYVYRHPKKKVFFRYNS